MYAIYINTEQLFKVALGSKLSGSVVIHRSPAARVFVMISCSTCCMSQPGLCSKLYHLNLLKANNIQYTSELLLILY